ncbi:hypothetical protein OG552_33285 [Streptomyces sp. NBC_01476]|uniref:hypothetical protein n=1 Tax=Streptomyces sp. NBC_01476 TaxID=2903881 RepID=UPI002E34D14C|nr:hypothetical protein [Streptomyces sp. NBC_01476]
MGVREGPEPTIKVASVTGWAVGDTLTVGTGPSQETGTVAAVGTAGTGGTGITLTKALGRAHLAGATAVDQGTGLTLTAGLHHAQAQGAAVATVVPAGTTALPVAGSSGIRAGDTLFVDAGANLVPDQLTETVSPWTWPGLPVTGPTWKAGRCTPHHPHRKHPGRRLRSAADRRLHGRHNGLHRLHRRHRLHRPHPMAH